MTIILSFFLTACSGGWRESYETFLDDLVGKVDVERQLENINAEDVIRDKLHEYSEGQTVWFQFGDFDSAPSYHINHPANKGGSTNGN